MAAAALLEQELQHSMAVSEEDADFEEDDEVVADVMEGNDDAYAANNQLHNGMLEGGGEAGDDQDKIGGDGPGSDEDAEGEDDDEMMGTAPDPDQDAEGEDEEDEDVEGVGAVKIQPGLSDEDEEAEAVSDEESNPSVGDDDHDSKDSSDAEAEVQWEPAPEEEEEGAADPNRCMYVEYVLINLSSKANTRTDFVTKTKKTIPARNSSCTCPVMSVVIMVCLPTPIYQQG